MTILCCLFCFIYLHELFSFINFFVFFFHYVKGIQIFKVYFKSREQFHSRIPCKYKQIKKKTFIHRLFSLFCINSCSLTSWKQWILHLDSKYFPTLPLFLCVSSIASIAPVLLSRILVPNNYLSEPFHLEQLVIPSSAGLVSFHSVLPSLPLSLSSLHHPSFPSPPLSL